MRASMHVRQRYSMAVSLRHSIMIWTDKTRPPFHQKHSLHVFPE